ncbi:MAG: hypothetical protein KKF44_04850, partial [Nanoarchaeota archaeon]|nr:hypothetical protein [Nanoarchaeota archaeon]
ILNGAVDQNDPNPDNGILNTFNLFALPENKYIWSINCTDYSGLSYQTENRTFYIDLTEPNINLITPELSEIIIGSDVIFNYSVIDNYALDMVCNITVDGVGEFLDIDSINNTIISRNMTIDTEIEHFWNVSCTDEAGNKNTSQTWNFSVRVPPTVQLISPDDGLKTTKNAFNFTYYTVDTGGIANASLFINGAINQTNFSVANDNYNAFPVFGLAEGFYNWTVEVFDNTGLSTTPAIRTFTIDYTAPTINIMHPLNQSTVTTNNFTIEFNVTDNFDTNITCDLYYEGALEYANISVINNTSYNADKSENDGYYNWSVACFDDINNTAYSGLIEFTVEAPPSVNLTSPANQTRTASQDIVFAYTVSDDLGIENCSLYIDSQYNTTEENPFMDQSNSFPVFGLDEGLHNWTVQCLDSAPDYNTYSPAEIEFRIDISGPAIVMNAPDIDEIMNINNITFNYTAFDSDVVSIDCNITVTDGAGLRINQTTGMHEADQTILLTNLTDGPHYWNVTCVDDLGNVNTSETRFFNINQPDMYLDNSRISFSDSNPDLFENITVFANITNIGGNPASNVLVSFWDGVPGSGINIGNDTRSIGIGASAIFNVTWNITSGYHDIWVVADPLNSIGELNETNNNATVNITVLSSTIFSPENNTWTNALINEFNFSLVDFTGGVINYSIYVDSVPNGQNGTVSDTNFNLLNITFSEGIHSVFVRAQDYLGRIKDSEIIALNVDVTDPEPVFETHNLTYFNNQTPEIWFNIDDNLDTEINYTLFVDGEAKNISTATDEVSTSVILAALSEGEYELVLEALDEAGNRKNSSSIIIFIDLTEPTIIFNYPPEAENFSVTNTQLNFTVLDNLDTNLTCNLTLDSSVHTSTFYVANNTVSSIDATDLSEGAHYWNVTCWDGGYDTNVNNINTSETRSFNVYIAPEIGLISPGNNNWTNLATTIFYFNASDATGLENCSLIIDNEINATKTGNELENSGVSNFTVIFDSGTYNWSIECFDNTSLYLYNTSVTRSLYVDLALPEPFIETQNQTWFNAATPLILFNITDNMDDLLNFTFYADGSINKQGVAGNATHNSTNLLALADGLHTIILEALDNAGNRKNSSGIEIYVDTIDPSIELHDPQDTLETTNNTILFNFTSYDNLAVNITCNLSLDSSVIWEGINATNGTENNFIKQILTSGTHYWNVTCIDLAGNTNTSETWYFTVPLPDLTLNSSNIMFNTSMPKEGENITINASVFNTGETNADDVIIQFIVVNDTNLNYSDGIQINGNFSVNITSKSNVTVSVSWIGGAPGEYKFYVLVDPPIETGGSIIEIDEDNNFAYNTLTITEYHTMVGSLSGILNIKQNSTNMTVFEWDAENYTDSNIFAADYDSYINWGSLAALGRNSTNQSDFNDFYELDISMKTENHTDSINKTWTRYMQPANVDTFVIFGKTVTMVPVVNSTNTSNFMTGILWDSTSQAAGGIYDGTQEIVFVTRVNEGQVGAYGTYDFEFKIPANLRQYKGPDRNTVALYTELK